MPLIDSSYFIGERDVPNTNYPDVLSTLNNLISIREREYLIKALGYELFKLFWIGLSTITPDQRFLDILLGVDFTGMNGSLKRWEGLMSITSQTLTTDVSLVSTDDLFFTVGNAGAPVNGDVTYVNADLAGVVYKVTQRGFGPLEPLKTDNSNVLTADIRFNSGGGFTWLRGTTFSQGDKYQIQLISTTIDVSAYSSVSVPDSPICDYVYYYWLKQNHTQTSGIGEVKPEGQNSVRTTAKYKAVAAWNSMVEKTCLLKEFLQVGYTVYPEYQQYATSRDLWLLLSKINIFF